MVKSQQRRADRAGQAVPLHAKTYPYARPTFYYPNLVDSDLWDSRVNMEGVVVQAGYGLSDAVFFNLTWGYKPL